VNILVVGKSGVGKSNLADVIKHAIFKVDKDCIIHTDDPDRASMHLGSGNNQYSIMIRKPENLSLEEEEQADIAITINNGNFAQWYEKFGD
jgi:nitrogenase subunit NifH